MNAKLEFTGISEIRLGNRGRIDAFHLSYVSPGANAGCHRPALLALALLIGGAQCHRKQHPHGLGPGRMAGLLAAPFVNRLLPLDLESKTEDGDLPTPWATALFSKTCFRHAAGLTTKRPRRESQFLYYEKSSRFVDAFHRKEFLYYEKCALRLVPRRSRR